MEAGCQVGTITVSEYTSNLLRDWFEVCPCGTIAAKNKGILEAYSLTRIKPAFSSDEDGVRPSSECLQIAR